MKCSAVVLFLSSSIIGFLLSHIGIAQGNSCSSEWFGPDCQYKCRCRPQPCSSGGTCTDSGKCELGWFGPACQYADLVMKNSVSLTPDSKPDDWVFDGNDTTCNEDTDLQTVTINLKTPILFTWIRIAIKDHGSQAPISIQFNLIDSGGNLQKCVNQRKSEVSDKTVDIYCEMISNVTQIILSEEGVKSLCSVHISGGRNIALKQNTSQSSTYISTSYPSFNSSNAVDGDTNGSVSTKFTSCTHTSSAIQPQYWILQFREPHIVYRYAVYNRLGANGERLKGFWLESFDEDNKIIFNYQDQLSKYQQVYTFLNTDPKAPVMRVNISLNTGEEILTLCEVEIYGDCTKGFYGLACDQQCSQNCEGDGSCQLFGNCLFGCKAGYQGSNCNNTCPEGQYGLGCSEKCSGNCASDEHCYHVNGTCWSGCKAGYKTHLCNETCAEGHYGLGCSENCSENCASDQPCHHVNGTCLSGCKAGYKTHLCNETCAEGHYGLGCSENCSGNCASDEPCYHVNGTCLSGCKAGYKTHLCNETCPDYRYGVNCSQNCSENCAGNGYCNPINGTCLSGCKIRYEGDLCETCSHGHYGDNCSEVCQNCAGDESCHPVNGTCFSGCITGYNFVSGLCQESLKATGESSTSTGAIVGSVMAVIVIAVLIFLGVMLWKRRKSPKSQEQYARSQPDGGDITLSPTDGTESGLIGPSSTEADRQNPQSGPYYNTLSHQETAIAVDKLGAFLFSHRREFYAEQFNAVPTTTNAVMTSGLNDENRLKNRYKNVCPYDHSRVLLKANPSKNQGDYINACYVGGYKNAEKFIASQGPNNTIMEDFIRMLWEQKVEKVVMLTNLVEEGKSKCDRYWPEESDIEFGDFKVILTTTQVFADYTIRKLHLAKEGVSTVHEFTHFHFTAWPDKGVPLTSWGLVDFEQRVFSSPSTKPIVVHCSAGVGRTGTFIALRNIIREAKETGQVDFYSTLWKLRQERMLMIQTLDQYIFLHRAAQVALVCTGTTVTAENISERMKVLQEQSASGETNIQREFREICSLCADYIETGEEENDDSEFTTYDGYDEDSLSVANKDKNRFCDVLPKKRYKTYIQGKDNTYINAVQVQSFTKQHQNILTQIPLPTTVTDFWSLVTQYKVSLIVAFEIDSKSTDKTIGEYYPSSEGELVSASHFKIQTGPAETGSFWTVQQLTVTSDETDVHRVIHVKPTFTDLNPEKLLALTMEIRNNTPPGDGRTVYMCRNGAQYSGLVCVLSLLLDRMDNDNCLAVPLVVGAIKSIRPQVIPTLEQYQVLYKMLQDFSEESNVYFNVGESKAKAPAVGSSQEYENVYANT